MNERERLLELKRKKERRKSNQNQEKQIRGRLTEFCGEIEFLERKLSNQLSQYEEGEQKLAVKSYRRDLSNQTEDEIRTESTLQECWSYLANLISIKIGSGNWNSLFQFIFDKSKSIRQDIEVQKLCSRNTIKIYEEIGCSLLAKFA